VKWGKARSFFNDLKRKMDRCGNLMPVPHKRKPHKLTPTKVKALEVYAREVHGDSTYEELSDALFERTGTRIDPSWLRKHIRCHWKVVAKRTKPSPNAKQQAWRLRFAKEHRRNQWEDWVDIDKKWFYLWVNKGTLKLPPGYEQKGHLLKKVHPESDVPVSRSQAEP